MKGHTHDARCARRRNREGQLKSSLIASKQLQKGKDDACDLEKPSNSSRCCFHESKTTHLDKV